MKKAYSVKIHYRKLILLSLYKYFFVLCLLPLLSGCGYTNPYVSKGVDDAPESFLLISIWENRTNELGLEADYFRLLNNWFKRSDRINVLFDEEHTDLKLTGEISSINLPGLFYDSHDEALEIKIRLTVSFTLYDNKDKRILWQERNYAIYEPFLLDPSGERTELNKQRALLNIGDEIAELIYMKVHEIVSLTP